MFRRHIRHDCPLRARAGLVRARTALVYTARGLAKSYGERLLGCNVRNMREGDPYLRTLLVQGAHHIRGPFGVDCDLRCWGLKLAEHGGKNGKKRAIIATARKLAVLLHRLWVSGEVYEPLRNSNRAAMPAAA